MKFDSASVAALAVLAIAALVLFGWAFDVRVLKSVIPDYITMKANTAIGFALLSAALLALRRPSRSGYWIAAGLCGFVMGLSVATLVEYLAGVDLGIDQLLFVDADGTRGHFPPGRLAPITALNFIALAVSILLAKFRGHRAIMASQLLAIFVLFAAFQSLVGYAIGLKYIFGSAFYTQMALHTGLCFVALSMGRLLIDPNRGLVRAFTANTPTTWLTRWMMVSAAFIPMIVRWAADKGFESGLYDHDFSQLAQVVGITGMMGILIVWAGTSLFKTEELNQEQRRALQESEEKFRALVSASSQIVWTADETGHIVEDSPSWRAFTGQSAEQWKIADVRREAIHPADRLRSVTAWKQATLARSLFETEYRIKHASGEWRWMQARAVPLLRPNGTIRGWIGMHADIHERKMAEIHLVNAKEEAERANQLKSAFLANMSHEIRTPLGAIVGFADLLRDPRLGSEDRTAFIETITRNGHQLAILINDILDLSKVEAGHLAVEYLAANPREAAAEVVSLLRVKAAEKNLSLTFEPDVTTPSEMTTDPVRLRQILINVIGNALKFTDRGGVAVRSSGYHRPNGKAVLRFEIEDTGIGIPEDQRDRVFEVFVQADGSMTRRFGGTGLGLSLSRKLARLLGGDVSIGGAPKEAGTTFVIEFEDRPEGLNAKYPARRDAGIDIPRESRTSLKGLRILVVDDAPDNLQLISLALRKCGATVESAENGLVAYQHALADNFDIVLMDLQMPIMDGYEATLKLRKAGFTKPIIALTAHAMAEVRKKCLDVGCTDHLPKPINFEGLVSAITRHASRSG